MSVSFAKPEQFAEIQLFLQQNWKKNHILGTNSDLLRWQYCNEETNELNFVVAIDDQTKSIVGILGFIPVSKYDRELKSQNEIWMALWKVAENQKIGVGLEILEFLMQYKDLQSIGVVGIVKKSTFFYEFLEFQQGSLTHYYIANANAEKKNIATIDLSNKATFAKTNLEVKEIILDENISLSSAFRPIKSIKYLINRFKKHPFYKYNFLGVFKNNELVLIITTRKIAIENSACIRIVDMYGELPKENIYHQMQAILKAENAEYIDCLNAGISEDRMTNLGFSIKSETEVIPNLFEPFEKENKTVLHAFKTPHKNYVVFKGDADQDRPNQL